MKNQNSPRIAIVHDYLKEFGGAEVVLEALSDIYPQADIFTTIYRPNFFGPHQQRLEKKWHHRVHQSFFGYFPFAHKLLSPFRFFSPIAFKTFDFSNYDLIITSATGAFFPNSINKKSAKLICYCHTPPRYLYNLATARSLDTFFYKLINIPLQFLLHFYRLFDFNFAQNVDQFIANSATTSARIQKFYRKNSIIINPPVEIPTRNSKLKTENFFLAGGRLTLAKRNDIAILACNKLKLPLKIFGRAFAGYSEELKKIAASSAKASATAESNIEFLGEISNDKRIELMSQAKAFIFCSDNEDFGIVPVESMAVGTPVVAYKSGGVTETVVEGKTGFFFDELSENSCAEAIKKIETKQLSSADCISQAKKFSRDVFVQKIKKLTSNI